MWCFVTAVRSPDQNLSTASAEASSAGASSSRSKSKSKPSFTPPPPPGWPAPVVGAVRARRARREGTVGSTQVRQRLIQVVAVPGRGTGQAGLRVGELLPGEPERVKAGDGFRVLVPLRAPRAHRADLPPVDGEEEVVHPVGEGGEFGGVRLAAQGEDEHRGGAVGLGVGRLGFEVPSPCWPAAGAGSGSEPRRSRMTPCCLTSAMVLASVLARSSRSPSESRNGSGPG